MLKRFLLSVLAAALLVDLGYAQSNTNGTTAVNKTTATSGKQMYINYCASCHGVDGRGNGPAAAALKMPPTDLTVLSRNTTVSSRKRTSSLCCSMARSFRRTARSKCPYGDRSLARWRRLIPKSNSSGSAI